MPDAKTDLNQIVIFTKVVETRSFTAAGKALGLPKSTVSRKVAQLEERLGSQLLERTTRRLSLTDTGAAFYERCARITRQIHEAERAIEQMSAAPHGLLRVSAPGDVGPAFLAEVVGEFLVAHPEVDVDLELTGRRVDLIEEGYDLCLTFGELPTRDEALLTTDLGPLRRALVASPEYIARHGLPTSPEQLDRHDFVVMRDARRGVTLELHGPENARITLSRRPRLVASDLTVLHRAVLDGAGIGLLPVFKCHADLERGRLRSLLHAWTRTEGSVHASYPTARHLAPKVRTFLEFLGETLDPPARVVHPAQIPLQRTPVQPSA